MKNVGPQPSWVTEELLVYRKRDGSWSCRIGDRLTDIREVSASDALRSAALYIDDNGEKRNVSDSYRSQSVSRFGQQMLDKLCFARNVAKGHWRNYNAVYLLRRLRQEVDELEEALAERPTAGVVSECCDVANFALMISDNAERGL